VMKIIGKSRLKINELSLMSVTAIHTLFIVTCVLCLVPFLFVVSASFSMEEDLIKYGFSLIPKNFTLEAYRILIGSSGNELIRAYLTTIFVTVTGTVMSLFILSTAAYALSRDLKYKSQISFFIYFAMRFSGGMVAWYLVCTQILHIQDTIWALIVPSLVSTWNIIILRTFIKLSVPMEIIESVKMDGGSEWIIYLKFILPLSKPGLATVALFVSLRYWNDWYLPMMLINRADIINLQYYMQRIMASIQMLVELSQREMAVSELANVKTPTESVRMAICLAAMGPMLLAAPFFQKYFIKGITVGSVKG